MRRDLTVGRPWVARPVDARKPEGPWEVLGTSPNGKADWVLAYFLSEADARAIAAAGNATAPSVDEVRP